MPGNVCIIHIEDEFNQMKSFVSRMRDYVDLYYLEQQNEDVGAILELKARSDDGAVDEWLVYEIVCPGEAGTIIRYILIGSEKIPNEVAVYLFEDRYFIVDVLRPSLELQRLWVTADTSLRSARENGGVAETITVFTACQGSDLDALKRANPGISFIEKSSIGELNRLISTIVVRSISNG